MEELCEKQCLVPINIDNFIQNKRGSSHENYEDSDSSSLRGSESNLRGKKTNKVLTPFSDSDSDSPGETLQNRNVRASYSTSQTAESVPQNEDSDSDDNAAKSVQRKSRIQRNILSDSEDSGPEDQTQAKRPSEPNSENEMRKSSSDSDNAVKNVEQQLRMKNKRDKLKNKFKSLLTVRNKDSPQINVEEEINKHSGDSSNDSEEELASIEQIKQKFKEKMASKPSICDPDTSDEESSQQKSVYKKKKERKTKLISPKPQRMSAKQAMENMQKIKSESNRMLREKEVSLPYHRPKAISLKDIMSRRKLAVSSDGKNLPIKMNEEQLKHYAKMLEEKQKEMLELCKSESEEEENELNPAEENIKDSENVIEKDATNISYVTNSDNTNGINNVNKLTEKSLEIETSNKGSEHIEEVQDSESLRLVYDATASTFDDNSKDITDKSNDVNIEIKRAEDTIVSEVNNHEYEKEPELEKNSVEDDSQLISLHFNTEDTESHSKDTTKMSIVEKYIWSPINNANKSDELEKNAENVDQSHEKTTDAVVNKSLSDDVISGDNNEKSNEIEDMDVDKDFSDDDINMEDIDNIIENAEIIKSIEDKVNSQFLVRDKPLNLNPKLTGSPGMVIDLEDTKTAPRKSGVELLKERFTYFSKLKTPEEIEREREKKLKPGTQLKKLKLELEEKIAEQRSLEWAKRLEDEKQQQHELKVLRGEESEEDDIDKIEAAIEGEEKMKEDSEESDSGEEEPEENDIEIKDKPRKKNAMVDDEAVESECENEEGGKKYDDEIDDNKVNSNIDNDKDELLEGNDDNQYSDDESESDNDSDESSESEEEQTVTKKGRILKAFEDSDDEENAKEKVIEIKEAKGTTDLQSGSSVGNLMASQVASQDDDLQLAQRPISTSDDVFTSQEIASQSKEQNKDSIENDEPLTQTFSILESSKQQIVDIDLNSSGKSAVGTTQSIDMNKMEDIAYQPTDSQNLPLPSQIPLTQSQSQNIGEDVVLLCTGQFYNNQFVSQADNNPQPLADAINYDAFDNINSQDSQDDTTKENKTEKTIAEKEKENSPSTGATEQDTFIELKATEDKDNEKEKIVDDNLKSILDELADPEFDAPKPNKYFLSSDRHSEVQLKRKLVIDSDDEAGEEDAEIKKRKKFKKKKPEKRALQISDDEEEQSEAEEIEEYESEIEEDVEEKLVEYDSEENEIEVKPQNPKKKRKMAEFFENEAELTSEDEWVGSGDEDEAGLDRMEREEGDDEVFHQGKLQKELGQIHMRDVLDQDKREVRLIQELLFEDGDLGGGGRQRRFKWNNMGEEEAGTVPDEFADTQEEEFESEEQWRKQRHEREMFLRQLHNDEEADESLNVSVNRTTIIKGNLLSKTMSTILMEAKNTTTEKTESTVTVEKKTTKDIPSPKKPFALLQPKYQGSLLSRGRGALARLAALATPLAPDDDAKVGTLGPTSRRNFVFAALTPEEKQPKVTKRKAESNPSTPNLLKKIRTEEKNSSRSSLLDHFKL